MRTKLIFGIVAVLMICSIFSMNQGADKFYYGAYNWVDGTKDFQYIGDSLRCNILWGKCSDTTIHLFTAHSLRAIVQNLWGAPGSPSLWAWRSHYTLWEAEGLDQSWVNLKYDGGTLVDDSSASGGKAMLFSVSEHDSGLVQTGPGYDQDPGPSGSPIYYTAEFRLKSPDYFPPDDTVCVLKVVGSGEILADSVVYSSQFTDSLGYKTFEIDYSVTRNPIQFQIYWFGERTLYIDYVKVYDESGWLLIDDPDTVATSNIKAYVDSPWVHTIIPETGDTVVYRWYLRDEPQSIDLFATNRYVDSLLREVSAERVGMQVFNKYREDTSVHEYFLRQNPEEYNVDLYPTRWLGQNFSGATYQQILSDPYIKYLSASKHEAENRGKDFWATIQTFVYGWELLAGDTCCLGCSLYYEYLDHGPWYCCDNYKRFPTPYEVRLQTFLALCYGADGIINWSYYSRNGQYGQDTTRREILLGLYDHLADTPTEMWYEIAHFSGPRVELLGPEFHELTWQGAGFHEDVATVPGNFINSLQAAPGETLTTTYVEVGFFKDDAGTDYFILVNRQCLENEDQSVIAYLDSADLDGGKMWYVIDQYSQDTTFTGAINGTIPFTTHLDPGEGKLFKLASFPDSAFHGTAQPLTWQGGIMIDGDVTVDSGKTLVIKPPAEITFFANTDVMKTWDTLDCDLVINGGLRAVGTETDSIVFTSTGDQPNDWEYITISSSSNVVLSHCGVEYGLMGIKLTNTHADTIIHCRFYNNLVAGIQAFDTSSNQVFVAHNYVSADSLWEGNWYGIDVSSTDSLSTIEDNVVDGYKYGVWVSGDSVRVSATHIRNAEFGLHASSCENLLVEDIEVTGRIQTCGLAFLNSNAEIRHCRVEPDPDYPVPYGVSFSDWGMSEDDVYSMRTCEVTNFSDAGVYLGFPGTLTPNLGTYSSHGNNKIYCDSAYLVYSVKAKGPADSVFAKYNWWGEYPPDSSRFDERVAFIPALEFEPEEPGSSQQKLAPSQQTPREFQLAQNYPNPFNPVTRIQFAVGSHQSPTHTTLKIYNILGQRVRTLVDEEKTEGTYTVYWDGRNQNGKQVSSGVYFYRLEAGDFTDVKKMVLLR